MGGETTVPGLGVAAAGTPSAITLSYIRSEIRARLGEDAADFWTDAFIDRQVNEAVRRFSNEEKWGWLFTERTGIVQPAGTATLLLEKDVTFSRHFDLLFTLAGDSRPRFPKRVLPAEGFSLRTRYYTDAEPEWYYLSKANTGTGADTEKHLWYVRFVPTPSKDMTIEYQYIRTPYDLTADSEEADVPRAYIEAVISWATATCWLRELNGSNKAQEQFNIYGSVVEQAKKDLGGMALDHPLVWGGAEPRTDRLTRDEWVRRHIPQEL